MDPFTAKNWLFGKAPKKLQLLGDKTVKVESAQHIIEFPGGAIEVSRTTDGDYWAHILVNRETVIEDTKGFRSKRGTVINSRIDRREGKVLDLDRHEEIAQIAVLVKSENQ